MSAADEPLPTVVIVGRPNVGKSTLFNAILRDRRSIVGNEPGITRDRIYGEAEFGGKRFGLIDTGGIIPDDDALIPTEILKQAQVALEIAAHVLFVIDGRTEITSADRDLAKLLRRVNKPLTLVVNKIDAPVRENLVHEFYSLGLGDPVAVSAEHRLGLSELLSSVTAPFPKEEEPETGEAEEEGQQRRIKVAIIGRPNVGKSTMLNALVGAERAIVSPVAGTTRDAVDESIQDGNTLYRFVDTAGIRRKGKTHEMTEKLSVVMARRHIRMANVVLLLVDAVEGVVGSDATIAGYAHEEGRAVIIVVNKWDAAEEKGKRAFTESIRDELKFLDYAPILFASAKNAEGIRRIFSTIRRSYDAASKRVTTGELNRFVATLKFESDIRIYYMTQASVRPPTFVVFTDKADKMHFSVERFLINQLRAQFGFEGTPIVIKTKRR
ncbi:MAG TPA: ribosome biogenesis GTPase Der [Bryobacteraceae bacterium]|jgi:GTP-binding protein|nr:ribosome biogenesis GTPase Der [Bryobacteraceae bacterium]